jgi:hypothetical protein
MQAVYNDGTFGERQEIDLEAQDQIEKLKELLEKQEVNHVNIFKETQQEIIQEKLDKPIDEKEMESIIEKKVKQELDRRDIINTYNKLESQK